jgi:hypothetical protein
MNKASPSTVNNNTLTILGRKNSFLIIGSIIILCTATIVLFSDKIIARAVVLSSKQENSISVLSPEPTKEEVLTWWCKSWKISEKTCNLLSAK